MGNIIIIDDSNVDRKIIKQILQKKLEDVNLIEADNGLDIFTKLISYDIDLCILDILMPEKNGFLILQEIKENPALKDIPVIVCTGNEDKNSIEKALTLGAYDYFKKPLSEEDMKISLPIKIKNALTLMKRNKEIIYLSYHDKLTGLYNRRFCEEEMKRLDDGKNLPLSIILGDVNGLKLTNDAFGHEAGDRLLIKIANIIKGECRKNDIVSRFGGDEFLILLPGTDVTETENIVTQIMNKCKDEKVDPIKPSISLGYAVMENNKQDIIDIYELAEDRMYNNKLVESKSIRSAIITSLQNTLYDRSHETKEHSFRLIELSRKLGEELNLNSEQLHNLRLLALLHDIGITGVPDFVFQKDGELTEEEWNIMKNHCETGYRIASSTSDLAHIAGDILSHHERWDGNGYPQGLTGKDIPINARIISVVDNYDTMVYGSFSQKVISKQEAISFIKKESGVRFDPVIVKKFLKIIDDEDNNNHNTNCMEFSI